MKYKIVLIIFVLNIKLLLAQDFIFSNPYNIRIIHNPAFTGLDQGQVNVNFIHRTQFNPIPGPFKTSAFSSDFGLCKPENVGVGLFAINESQGDGFLQTNNFGITSSVNIKINDGNFKFFGKHLKAYSNAPQSLSVGFQLGFLQQSVDWSKYVFSDQITYQGINKDVVSINGLINPKVGFAALDLSMGILYRKRIMSNSKKVQLFIVGVSFNHLNNPNIGLVNEYNLPIKTNAHIGFLKEPTKDNNETGFSLNTRLIQQQNFKNTFLDLNAELSKMGLIGILAFRTNTSNYFFSNTQYIGLGVGYEKVYNDNSFKGVLNYDLNISGVSGNSFGIWELTMFLTFNNGCYGSSVKKPICNYTEMGKAPQF
jgi:type IX secretion system PorP/SprF family membrane protein